MIIALPGGSSTGILPRAFGPAMAHVAPAPAPVALRPPVPGWNSVGRVTDKRLDEISGVVASRTHPGTLWVHNDSGGRPRVFAIGTDGAMRAEVQVDGAIAIDWEDISFGPGPRGTTGDWLYVADTGDNFRRRRALSIYRFAEPSSIGDGRVTAERINVRFDDDRRHNIEALFVDPHSGDTMLVTKVFGASAKLFRIPPRPFDGSTVIAEQVLQLSLGSQVTGADISSDGSRVVIRTKSHLAMWEREVGESIALAVKRAPVMVAAPDSEAIAFSPDRATLYSIDEGVGASVDTRPVP